MSSTPSPTTREQAALEMATVQGVLAKVAREAFLDQARIVARLVVDGADLNYPAGVLMDWLEMQFPHLVNMIRIDEKTGHDDLIIRGVGDDGETYVNRQDLPRVYRGLNRQHWTPADLERLAS